MQAESLILNIYSRDFFQSLDLVKEDNLRCLRCMYYDFHVFFLYSIMKNEENYDSAEVGIRLACMM